MYSTILPSIPKRLPHLISGQPTVNKDKGALIGKSCQVLNSYRLPRSSREFSKAIPQSSGCSIPAGSHRALDRRKDKFKAAPAR